MKAADRVVIVGLGSIGRRHLRIGRQVLPDARFIALRHERCGEEVEGMDECVTSIDDALRTDPLIAVISNPSPFHLRYAQAFAEAGVNLLVEKPISNGTHGVPELIDACRAAGTVLATGYNLRFSPSLNFFADSLRAERIGTVQSVAASVSKHLAQWRPDFDYRRGVSARSELGGGVLLELSHEIDYLRWIFGEVSAVSGRVTKESDLEIDVEDTAELTLELTPRSGGVQISASLGMYFGRNESIRECIASGSRGDLRWNGIAGSVDMRHAGSEVWSTIFSRTPDRDETYVAEWLDFVGAIAEGRAPRVTGEDGLAAMRVVEAARRASLERGRVALAVPAMAAR